MYIERDSRRQQAGARADNQQAQANYLTKCLDLITNYLVEIVPQILGKMTIEYFNSAVTLGNKK